MQYDRETMIFTVSQMNEYIKMLLESSPVLASVSMRGEISNFTAHRSGHYYFTLKDEGGQMRAVMFRSAASRLPFVPENGMRVIVRGRVSVYSPSGQYQFYAEGMEPDGLGALALAYEQLRQKLEAEGLFDQSRKKPLPAFPRRIGVITSPTGAAVRDMINVLTRRFPLCEMVLFPALVQGEGAAVQLCSGIRYFNRSASVDLIIIGRGGGSAEDLWAFNNEELARCIADSTLPVISAVGHEVDYTICDFVADLRAPTPSAAMELALPDCEELRDRIGKRLNQMVGLCSGQLQSRRRALRVLQSARVLASPGHYVDQRRMDVLHAEQQLTGIFSRLLADRHAACTFLQMELEHTANSLLQKAHKSLAESTARLEALNPLSVLSRGYSAVFDTNNRPVCRADQVQPGQMLRLRFSDGTVDSTVQNVKRDTTES